MKFVIHQWKKEIGVKKIIILCTLQYLDYFMHFILFIIILFLAIYSVIPNLIKGIYDSFIELFDTSYIRHGTSLLVSMYVERNTK